MTERRANAHVTPASGVPCATTTATAASTPSATRRRGDACAILVGRGGTVPSSVTATIHRATSSRDAASARRDCGAHGVKVTAIASKASATKRTARVPARQGTVGGFAGNRVLPGSTVKTAGTGGATNLSREQMHHIKNTGNMQFHRCLVFNSLVRMV